MFKEKWKEFWKDFNTATDELLGIDDLDDLENENGEIVPVQDAEFVVANCSNKSKAPISPINKMKDYYYSVVKNVLREIKKEKEKIDEEIKLNQESLVYDKLSTEEANKSFEERNKLVKKSDRLKKVLDKGNQSVAQYETDKLVNVMNKIEEDQKLNQGQSLEPIQTIEQAKNIEEQQAQAEVASSVQEIINTQEQPVVETKTEQIIKSEPIKEITQQDKFADTINKVGVVFDKMSIDFLKAMQEEYNARLEKAKEEVRSNVSKYVVEITDKTNSVVATYKNEIAKQDQVWQNKYNELEQSKNQVIAEKDRENADLRAEIENYKAIIEQKNNEIETKNNTIIDNNTRIGELTEQNAAKDKEIAARDSQINDQDNEIERLQVFEKRFNLMSEAMAPIARVQSASEEKAKTL